MGTSLSATMQIGLSGMQTAQSALSTTSHNLSNTNSSSYTRQQVIITSTSIEGFGAGSVIAEVRRVVDDLLSTRLTEQTSAIGYAETRDRFLANLEVIFGAPQNTTSMDQVLNDFFNELSNLANDPDSSSLQINTVNNAAFVVQTLNAISSELNATIFEIEAQIENEIDIINEAIVNVYELNSLIAEYNISNKNDGTNANDLIDERQRQINIIAERLNINTTVDQYGRARLITESGRRLVDTGYTQLERIPSTPPALWDDIGVRGVKGDGSLSPTVFPILMDNISDGSLKALTEVRDTQIPTLQAEINEFAETFITEFNKVHSQGTGIPPKNSFTTGNGHLLSAPGADLTAELGISAGDSFEISVVDIATGQTISTTLAAGGGAGPITIAAGDTYASIIASITGNADVGALINGTTFIDADGNQQMTLNAINANYALVFSNNTGDVLGEIGMNNFFTGTDASTIAVREDIIADASLVATARMRTTDGGVSFNDNQNAIALAQLADKPVTFDAAGGFATKTESITSYFIGITTKLAVDINSNEDYLAFSESLYEDIERRNADVSGVNMDEELSNLIIFQRAFQASAQIVSIIDELYVTILDLI